MCEADIIHVTDTFPTRGLWTYQLNDLSLDLMHGGALEHNRIMWRSVDTESSHKRLCYGGGKTKSVNEKIISIIPVNCMFITCDFTVMH